MGSDCVSMPVLYKANETNFQHLGLGALAETTEALVTEERNGQFFLDLKYPIDGMMFNELKNDRLIKVDASNDLKQQRFKIVRITKPSKGIVSVYAEHVSLHTQEMQLKPKVEYSGNAQMALNTWKDNIVDEHPFTVFSDIEHAASGEWTIEKVDSARRALGGVAGSLLDSYGGEYRFDNYHIGLYQARGNDNGALIAYGKNLTDLEQDEQIANTYTSVYPFSVLTNEEDETEEIITLPEYFVDSEHVEKYARRKILLVDFSEEKIDRVDSLRSRTISYMKSNNIGVPSVNLKVKFMDLAKTLDYKHLKLIEEINLCDWVNVYFQKLDVRQKAKVIKTIWNVLLDRYEEIELGNSRSSLTKSIENTVDGKLETVIARMNTIQLSANGKTKIYRGPDMPTGGTNGDVWYKPVGNGEVEMYLHDGAQWNFEEISATSLAGTINFSKLNVIDFIADNISGGRLNLANDLTISNGDKDVLYVDPQTGAVVGNFSSIKINFEEVATQKDLEEIELTPGESGKTAYELAVENGFVGTESEWLESLKGTVGSSGKSAYEIAVEKGFVGTEQQWLDSLEGADGSSGESGKSAYDIAVENGFGGTEKEWLDSLKGADGEKGSNGISVQSIQEEYYKSTSATSLVGGSWGTTVPAWESGKYIWTRVKTFLSNGSVQTTDPVNTTGAKGSTGSTGATRYVWTKYADNAQGGGISDTPTGKKYIGHAYNKTTQTESNIAADYTWTAMYDLELLEEVKKDVEDIRAIVTIRNTPEDNYGPDFYGTNWADHLVREFKRASTLGLDELADDDFGTTETITTNGIITQTFSTNTQVFRRYGTVSTDIWEPWEEMETVRGSQQKANDAVGEATGISADQAEQARIQAENYAKELHEVAMENVGTINEDLVNFSTSVEADINNLKYEFTAVGGDNLLYNSVGFDGVESWVLETATIGGNGNVSTLQNQELETYGAGSAFVLANNTKIKQTVQKSAGLYVISSIVQKSAAGTGYIHVRHAGGDEFISINAIEYDYEPVYLAFQTSGTEMTIELFADVGAEITFTSTMLNAGSLPQRWSLSNNELYGTGFRMNRNGFRVYDVDGTRYTNITPDEFAGYAEVGGEMERTFALNGAVTEVKELEAQDRVAVGNLNMIRVDTATNHGIAFVRGGN